MILFIDMSDLSDEMAAIKNFIIGNVVEVMIDVIHHITMFASFNMTIDRHTLDVRWQAEQWCSNHPLRQLTAAIPEFEGCLNANFAHCNANLRPMD